LISWRLNKDRKSLALTTMAVIVQKYGGTSVGSVERIQSVAQRVKNTVIAGNTVVVVVSAMGKTTDGLVNLVMSMALEEIGQPAISLTGAQVGIVTESEHSRARILEIKTDRLSRHLSEGKVVVVAGFQGVSDSDQRRLKSRFLRNLHRCTRYSHH